MAVLIVVRGAGAIVAYRALTRGDGGSSWAGFLTTAYCPVRLAAESQLDGPPQPSGDGEFGVVCDVFAGVERTRLLRHVGRRVYGDVLDIRVKFVGMWRGMGTPVVSAPLVDRLAAAPNRRKRYFTGGASGSVVGREVVGHTGLAALG